MCFTVVENLWVALLATQLQGELHSCELHQTQGELLIAWLNLPLTSYVRKQLSVHMYYACMYV